MGCHSFITDNMLEVLYMAHSEAWIGGEVSQRQHGSDGGSTVAWISQWVGVKRVRVWGFLFIYWVWWWVVTRERGVWDWESLREFREWVWESFFFFFITKYDQIHIPFKFIQIVAYSFHETNMPLFDFSFFWGLDRGLWKGKVLHNFS